MNRPQNINIKDWQILKEKYPDNLEQIVSKIKSGYPIQYLIGDVEFLDCLINVDDRVLIPRFETEYLVSLVIDYAKKHFNHKISTIDLGTGSGCIAIALKKHLNSQVSAVDISLAALDLARKNAQKNNVEIEFIHQDMLSDLNDNYDIIISNPPYIPHDGYVEDRVLKYEPHLALFAEDNGLYFYKQIINQHLKNLNKPGLMAFEIGDNESSDLQMFLDANINLKYEFASDLTARTRYLFIFNE